MGIRIGRYTDTERLRKRKEFTYAVLLDPYIPEAESPIVTVLDTPLLIQAYNLPAGERLMVYSVYGDSGEYEAPFVYKGVELELTNENNPILLAFSGRYRVKASGPNTGVRCVAIPYNSDDYMGEAVEQPNGAQSQRPNVLFGPDKPTLWSTTVQVGHIPQVLTAYGLGATDSVQVYAAFGPDADVYAEYWYRGQRLQITASNNPIVLEQTGRYKLQLNAPAGSAIVTAHPLGTDFDDPYSFATASGVTTVVAGTGIDVGLLDPTAPVISLDAATQAAVAAAELAVQPGDNVSDLDNDAGYITSAEAGGQVDSVVAGTGVAVDATDPVNPLVSLDSATQLSLGLADTSVQPGDNVSLLTNDAGYIDAAGADAQIDLQKGVAGGIAPLNGATQIDTTYIPPAVLGQVEYKGTWDASTGAPPTAAPEKGWYYVVTVDGTTNLDGITDWVVGDWAIYNGTAWDKVDNTDAISSWNGRTGAILPQFGDYTFSLISDTPTTLAGYGITDGYTDARARAATITQTITDGDTTHAPSADALAAVLPSFGTYTPTGSSETNVSSVDGFTCSWFRLGNTVYVDGRVDIDPVSTGGVVALISLPVPSEFINGFPDASGTFLTSGSTRLMGVINASDTGNSLRFVFDTPDVFKRQCYFHCAYQVN